MTLYGQKHTVLFSCVSRVSLLGTLVYSAQKHLTHCNRNKHGSDHKSLKRDRVSALAQQQGGEGGSSRKEKLDILKDPIREFTRGYLTFFIYKHGVCLSCLCLTDFSTEGRLSLLIIVHTVKWISGNCKKCLNTIVNLYSVSST